MIKKKIFIYPSYKGTSKNPGNLYIRLFQQAFENSDKFRVLERKVIGKPFWDLYFNIDAKIFCFNWVEGHAFHIVGFLKFLYLLSFFIILRLLHKDIIWILHNKHPHNGKNERTEWAMSMMALFATLVITHSQEGVTFFNKKYPKKKGKCVYIPHPVYSTDIHSMEKITIKWDYIIWGEIQSRKGIVDFMQYANSHEFYRDKKILICGRCKDEHYMQKMQRNKGLIFDIDNRFIPDDEMHTYILQSKIILFTYHESSVLSSGALVYSLNFHKPIIGPNTGAFADMKGIVTCYNSFDEIEKIVPQLNEREYKCYITKQTWKQFPLIILKILSSRYK